MLIDNVRPAEEKCDKPCLACNLAEAGNKPYDITCPVCGGNFKVKKSLAHLCGVNDFGRGRCPGCMEELNIVHDPENDSMKARKYEEFNGFRYKPTITPCSLDQCLDVLSKEVIIDWKAEEIKELPEKDFVIDSHFGLGRWLRNEWDLWLGDPEDSPLVKYFNDLGIDDGDDMSSIILTSYHRHLNGKELQLEEQVKYYKDFWNLQVEVRK